MARIGGNKALWRFRSSTHLLLLLRVLQVSLLLLLLELLARVPRLARGQLGLEAVGGGLLRGWLLD